MGSLAIAAGVGLLAGAYMSSKKNKKADTGAITDLVEEKKVYMRKRKALYNTQGGVLGQEVNQVGQSGRGNIFGN